MDWKEENQLNESSETEIQEDDQGNQSSDDVDEENTNNDRDTIRADLKSMPFSELLKLKEELGSKLYNEAVFGNVSSKKRKNASKMNPAFKRDNKNRPREISAKKQTPLLGKNKMDQRPRDPRFDSNCGEFDRQKFKEDYSFVNDIREKEIADLKTQMKQLKSDQSDKKEQIKWVLQRMQNQNLENKKHQERQQIQSDEKKKNVTAIKSERKPFFTSNREKKALDLVKQFEELKKAGKLNKHLEKRRKKNLSRDRRKYNFD